MKYKFEIWHLIVGIILLIFLIQEGDIFGREESVTICDDKEWQCSDFPTGNDGKDSGPFLMGSCPSWLQCQTSNGRINYKNTNSFPVIYLLYDTTNSWEVLGKKTVCPGSWGIVSIDDTSHYHSAEVYYCNVDVTGEASCDTDGNLKAGTPGDWQCEKGSNGDIYQCNDGDWDPKEDCKYYSSVLDNVCVSPYVDKSTVHNICKESAPVCKSESQSCTTDSVCCDGLACQNFGCYPPASTDRWDCFDGVCEKYANGKYTNDYCNNDCEEVVITTTPACPVGEITFKCVCMGAERLNGFCCDAECPTVPGFLCTDTPGELSWFAETTLHKLPERCKEPIVAEAYKQIGLNAGTIKYKTGGDLLTSVCTVSTACQNSSTCIKLNVLNDNGYMPEANQQKQADELKKAYKDASSGWILTLSSVDAIVDKQIANVNWLVAEMKYAQGETLGYCVIDGTFTETEDGDFCESYMFWSKPIAKAINMEDNYCVIGMIILVFGFFLLFALAGKR